MLLRLRRRLLAATLAAVASAGLVLVPVTPAMAACHDVGCNGLDPSAHCSTTSTPDEVGYWGSVPAATLQIRRSSGCASFWARGLKDCIPSVPNPVAYVRITRQVYGYYGYYTSNQYYSPQVPCGGSPVWSPMVADYGNDRAQACWSWGYVYDPPQTFPEHYWSLCTDWIY
ncbi:hypothetical protein I0C86_23235 [Plantactinospora sp. S1510]|uniref:DUF2690 domain-containing protein n=1 Tax=Plantactinospora alkalitolerans TaxID=2789879 RepID=A0ABS0H065_9ACTN|nr:hypothetical protein [Plantactinospora alkalitolerans]MBF9131856.1 hypothetical protein [Plantactinospora alkalitolerans]